MIWRLTEPRRAGRGSVNLKITVGAFVLAFGILLSVINFVTSLRAGRLAGNNPWNADSLEWSVPSPPPPYGSVHIPTVRSRNPLWDDYDEEADPTGERILDEGRLTLASTPLDAIPFSLARMPEDSIIPLLLGLTLTGVFTALTFKLLWVAVAFMFASVAVNGLWLWPKHREDEV